MTTTPVTSSTPRDVITPTPVSDIAAFLYAEVLRRNLTYLGVARASKKYNEKHPNKKVATDSTIRRYLLALPMQRYDPAVFDAIAHITGVRNSDKYRALREAIKPWARGEFDAHTIPAERKVTFVVASAITQLGLYTAEAAESKFGGSILTLTAEFNEDNSPLYHHGQRLYSVQTRK